MGPQTTRFSRRPIHSSVRSADWVGAGMEERPWSQVANVLPVGKAASYAAGGQRRTLASSDLLIQQQLEHFGRIPALRTGGGQHFRRSSPHMRQPHAT